jgi:hypothetical protein
MWYGLAGGWLLILVIWQFLLSESGYGFVFYSFNMMGKASWCEKTAMELLNRLKLRLGAVPEVFVTVEAKAIARAQELARNLRHDRGIEKEQEELYAGSGEFSWRLDHFGRAGILGRADGP